jgi:DNA polymerase-3 subunit delta
MPITLLYGNDDLAISQRADKFGEAFADPTSADMNTTRIEGKGADEGALSNAINAMPFLAAQRLVILNAPSLRYNNAELRKKFLAFLETIPPSTQLVLADFVENKKREEDNHWLVKWARKKTELAAAERFMMPGAREMPGWIIAEAKKQGGKIDPPAAARLAEMTGENTRQAAQEIVKLLTYVNFERAINVEDVERVSIVTAKVDAFDVIDAIGRRNGKQAQKLLHQLLEEEDEFKIFGLLVSQFRLLLIAREMIDDNRTLAEATEALGIHPFRAEKVYGQARNFSLQTLEQIHHRFLAMDEAAKTGQMNLDLSLETLIVEMTQ